MAALCTRVKVTFRDRYGQEAGVVFHVAPGIIDPNNSAILLIIGALESLMRAKALRIELTQINGLSGAVTSSVAYVSQDKALMNGIDGDGQAHNWKIPGIKTTVFESDKETIDLGNTDVHAWVLAVLAGAQGRGGGQITGITRGHRTMGKRLKR